MSAEPPDKPPAGLGGLTSLFKGMLGMPSGGSAAGSSAAAAAAGGSKPPASAPKAIRAPPPPRDTFPEIVMTPSEVGVYEVSHAFKGGFTWRKFFEAPPRTPRSPNDGAGGGFGAAAGTK